ncbi:MAG: pyruvate kinase [Phycisphaerales bacterium]
MTGVKRARPTLAKIVATVGPASQTPDMIERLINSGVSVFRLNFSHGGPEDHAARLRTIREVAARLGQPIAVLGDLPGPKIRVGVLPDAGVELAPGDEVLISARFDPEQKDSAGKSVVRLTTEYPELSEDVQPGHRVLINDGAVRLLAVEPEVGDRRGELRCRVLVGGTVTSRKGINLPDSGVRARAITERDWEWVAWSVAQGVDLLALSFVRTAGEVRELKEALATMCPAELRAKHPDHPCPGVEAMIPVIAKIEKPQALDVIDEILEVADGVMVARGDLGVEMDLAAVPVVQKRLISKCDDWGKPCIVATQMLESMIQNATPTRAEASDVANGVLDGADAVMLSGETAVGRHPALVVDTMRRIVEETEKLMAEQHKQPSPAAHLLKSRYRTAALAHGAWHISRDIGAVMIVCWSQEGGTARYLSQTGVQLPIVAYSSSPRHVRRMALLRGVTPRLMSVPRTGTLAEWNAMLEKDLLDLGWVCPGEAVVLLAGKPLGIQGSTNAVAVHTIGSTTSGFMRV